MSSGESLNGYMDPYMITYASPLSDCEDIMELDDETDFEKNKETSTLTIHSPNNDESTEGNANIRRKSKNTNVTFISDRK